MKVMSSHFEYEFIVYFSAVLVRKVLSTCIHAVCAVPVSKVPSTYSNEEHMVIFRQWHLEEEEYLCHFNMANQALRRGRPVLARLSLQQALTFASRLHNKPRLKEIYCQLAIVSNSDSVDSDSVDSDSVDSDSVDSEGDQTKQRKPLFQDSPQNQAKVVLKE